MPHKNPGPCVALSGASQARSVSRHPDGSPGLHAHEHSVSGTRALRNTKPGASDTQGCKATRKMNSPVGSQAYCELVIIMPRVPPVASLSVPRTSPALAVLLVVLVLTSVRGPHRAGACAALAGDTEDESAPSSLGSLCYAVGAIKEPLHQSLVWTVLHRGPIVS